ncbi:ankyrin repeat-containing domain protein [Nemania sp. NC0429]|nr:ankyrin repeat-containing domain protein [Nemania sp. NC0429]
MDYLTVPELDMTLESLIREGDTEAVRVFLAGATESEVDLSLVLFKAIYHRKAEIVKNLIRTKALLNSAYDFSRATPLHFQTTYEFFRPPITHLFSPNPLDDRDVGPELCQLTPLHCAARRGDVKIVQYLLEAGAPVDARSQSNETPLHSALSALSSLLDALQADKNFDASGHGVNRATTSDYVSIVKLLVDAKASVDSASPRHSILYYAVRDFDLVRYLVEHSFNKEKFLNTLHQDDQTSDQLSALWGAMQWCELRVVRYLVEKGANPLLTCTINGVSKTAIHAAFEYGTVVEGREKIEYLIGEDRNQLNKEFSEGNTCLHLAAKMNKFEYVDYFLSKGADCTALNRERETPWQTARNSGSAAAASAFLKAERDNVFGNDVDGGFRGSTWFTNRTGYQVFSWNESKAIGLALERVTRSEGMRDSDSRSVSQWFDHSFIKNSDPDSILCIPYFSVQSSDFLTKRWEHSLKSVPAEDLRYCRPYNPKHFGVDIEVTLDEHCNPALSSTILKRRNKNQVLTCYLERLQPKLSQYHPLQLLTVPQLWCWKIGSAFILSAVDETGSKLKDILNPHSGDDDIAVGRILSQLIDNLDRPMTGRLTETIFSVLSKSISAIAEEVNEYTGATNFDNINIEKEKQFLDSMNDIREEIAMMQTVLFQQEEVWKQFTYNTWPHFWPDGEEGRFKPPINGQNVKDNNANNKSMKIEGADDESPDDEIWREIAKPQSQFSKYRKRFQKLDEDTQRVEKHILVQLDLKQKHAAINRAHTTTVMSAAIVGFTVVTIIFAPLTFITSLFALPIHGFQSQTEGEYTTDYIGTWMATGEILNLAATTILILLAFVYFVKLRVPITKCLMAPKGFFLNRLTSKEATRNLTNTQSSSKETLAYPAGGGSDIANRGTNPKSSNVFQNWAKARVFQRSKNQTSLTADLESGG